MEIKRSHFEDCGDDCPMDNVSWNDAQELIKRLNQTESGARYRLPTEAESELCMPSGKANHVLLRG